MHPSPAVTTHTTDDAQSASHDRMLEYVQTLVARRADEILSEFGGASGHDLESWLQAEQEIFHAEPPSLQELQAS